LGRALRLEGYDVVLAADGRAGQLAAARGDAMVLDATMPNLGGFELCRRLRAAGSDLPILILTARHATADRVEGLDAGADDYLVKPFELQELLARVRALLRRRLDGAARSGAGAAVLSYSDLTLDPSSREVERAGEPVDLTRTEFALLELLLEHPNQVLTRDQIYEAVWGYDSSLASNSLEVYVGYLRRKTEAAGERLIQTVRGVGYVLREPRRAAS
ncbi:MAG TPA: DNA-binding response regulator, partial [Acidimicrobiaceae bacterium]|nr:DNA-binding response regulator [Acidimicrobiaceae bacterium]